MILDIHFILGLNLSKPTSFNRICSLAYLYQKSGVISNINFKLPGRNISSSDVDKILTKMLDKGYIIETKEGYMNTDYFNNCIDNFPVTNLENSYIDDVSRLLQYSTSDLVYLCTVSMLLDKILQDTDYNDIDSVYSKIKDILKFMYSEYDTEDLNKAFKILNKLKEVKNEYQK